MVKPGGTGRPEIGHLGEVGALAAQQIAQARFAFGLAVAEREHPFAGFCRLKPRAGPQPACRPVSAPAWPGSFFKALRAAAGGAALARDGGRWL